MKCPKCSHLNEDEARYCNNCGFPLMEKKKDWPSILLLAWCVSLLFFTLIWKLIFPAVSTWIHSMYEYDFHSANKVISTIAFIGSTAQYLTYLVIPFAIPKIGFKIAAFIIIGLVIIWATSANVINLISVYSY